MNPFAALIREPAPRVVRDIAPDSSLTRTLLHLIDCNGPMSTNELADAGAMTSKQVWGLLKAPRALGQVRYVECLWELDRDFPGADVVRACELLRDKGWKVTPP